MPLTLTLPTPLDAGTEDTWGTTYNTAFGAVETFLETQETGIASLDTRIDALEATPSSLVFKVKVLNDSRSSNTTLTDDNELVGMNLATGTWLVDVVLHYGVSATGDTMMVMRPQFSGTTTTWVRGCWGPTDTGSGTINNTPSVFNDWDISAGFTSTASVTYGHDRTIGGVLSYIREKYVMVVTGAGALKIQHAQAISLSSPTTLVAGSYVKCRKVA